jgi:hypothetical protein
MMRFMSILASVALVAALMPIAANATAMTSLDYARTAAHQAISAPGSEVQRVATCHAATAQRTTNQTVVTSGWGNQLPLGLP